jgi:hypothetical protein
VSDGTSVETDDESQDVIGVPSAAAAAGRRGVPRNVHTWAVRNLSVVMVTQASVANQASPPGSLDIIQMLVHMDALQNDMASLAGCVSVLRSRHRDTPA